MQSLNKEITQPLDSSDSSDSNDSSDSSDSSDSCEQTTVYTKKLKPT